MAKETDLRITALKRCKFLVSAEFVTQASSLQEEKWTASIHLGAKPLWQIQLKHRVLVALKVMRTYTAATSIHVEGAVPPPKPNRNMHHLTPKQTRYRASAMA
jgi:hypothetical protein